MIQGLILAAGKGHRLGSILNGKPKGLLTVGDRTLLEHQIRSLRFVGVGPIAVVVGYGARYVREALRGDCEFIENLRFASTNSLYSLWLARHWVQSDFVLVNSDVLADPRIYERLVGQEGTALAYDATSGTHAEEMKVSLTNGRVTAICKSLTLNQSNGESIGMIKFDRVTARRLFEASDKIVRGGSVTDWSPAAVAAITDDSVIRAIDVAGIPWTEVDFPEDLEYAQTTVWPRIQGGGQPGRRSNAASNSTNGASADSFASTAPLRGPTT